MKPTEEEHTFVCWSEPKRTGADPDTRIVLWNPTVETLIQPHEFCKYHRFQDNIGPRARRYLCLGHLHAHDEGPDEDKEPGGSSDPDPVAEDREGDGGFATGASEDDARDLARWSTDEVKVLELGAGTARFSSAVAAESIEVVPVDRPGGVVYRREYATLMLDMQKRMDRTGSCRRWRAGTWSMSTCLARDQLSTKEGTVDLDGNEDPGHGTYEMKTTSWASLRSERSTRRASLREKFDESRTTTRSYTSTPR